MTTLKITVNSKRNAQLLTRLLKSMAFVKRIEEDSPLLIEDNQINNIKSFFNAIEPDSIFRSIKNPVEFQNNLRNEWDTRWY